MQTSESDPTSDSATATDDRRVRNRPAVPIDVSHRVSQQPNLELGSKIDLTNTPRPRPSYLDQLEKLNRNGKARWRDADGLLYEYDPNHGGEIEVYSKRGEHLAVAHILTGEWIKPPVRGRTIDV